MVEETRDAPYFNGEDRISSLQDDLIHYILSFIDTKYVVQTSVLSKRWIDIWKSIPFLNFNRDSFSEDRKDSFIMFVDMVLFFRKECDIQKFNMQWKNSAYDNTSVIMNVKRWSLGAVKYNVKEFWLLITQCHDSAYEIPHRLLNCKSLRKLVIGVYGYAAYADIILPSSMSLPQLKTLGFLGLSVANVESFKRLFSSCPVLKTVRLVNCNIQTNDQRNLTVESLSLKKFVYFDSRSRLLLPQDITADIVKLCAPNLLKFTCKSFLSRDFSLEICSPLLGVSSFDMKLKAKTEDENAEAYSKLPSTEKDVYAKRVMKFLGAVYMVKSMSLSPGFLEVLSQAPDLPDCRPPRLLNLKCLTLEMWGTRGCLRAIAYLLSISPKVTKFFLESKESNLADVGDDWDVGLSLPEMLPCLKSVQIKEVEGCDNELKFLSFLLKKSTNLKKVVLYPRSTIKLPKRVKRKFRDKLRALPRASSRIRMEWPATKSIRI